MLSINDISNIFIDMFGSRGVSEAINVVNCQGRNVMITCLKIRNWCGKNGVLHSSGYSHNISNDQSEREASHVRDAALQTIRLRHGLTLYGYMI